MDGTAEKARQGLMCCAGQRDGCLSCPYNWRTSERRENCVGVMLEDVFRRMQEMEQEIAALKRELGRRGGG